MKWNIEALSWIIPHILIYIRTQTGQKLYWYYNCRTKTQRFSGCYYSKPAWLQDPVRNNQRGVREALFCAEISLGKCQNYVNSLDEMSYPVISVSYPNITQTKTDKNKSSRRLEGKKIVRGFSNFCLRSRWVVYPYLVAIHLDSLIYWKTTVHQMVN